MRWILRVVPVAPDLCRWDRVRECVRARTRALARLLTTSDHAIYSR